MHYAYGFFYFLYQLEPKSCFHKDGYLEIIQRCLHSAASIL